MAKIKIIKAALLAATALSAVSIATPALSQTNQELLQQAQEAESQRYWAAAEKFYRQFLQRNPGRADLWERLGDIIVAQGNRPEEAAEVFGKAADLDQSNVNLQMKASQAMSVANNPAEASRFMQRAVELSPGNFALIEDQAVLQTWEGDYAGAEQTLQLGFDQGLERNATNLLRLSEVQKSQGKLRQATDTLDEVEKMAPDNLTYLLQRAQVYYLKGDFIPALEKIDEFAAGGGDDFTHKREKALYLAWANLPDDSLELSEEALQAKSDDAQLVTSQIVSLNKNRDYERAAQALDFLDGITGPDSGAMFTRRLIETPLKSNLDLRFRASTDRDNVFILGGEAIATFALKPGSFVRVGFEGYRARGKVFSGLDRIDNVRGIFQTGFWGEVEAPLSKKAWVNARAGFARTDFGNNKIFKGGFTLFTRPSQKTTISAGFNRDFFLVSARALSLGIVENEMFGRIEHTPNPNWYTSFRVAFTGLSDTNRRKRADLTIIRKAVRHQDFNFDVGFSATWFGYKFTFANGYYNPQFLQQYFIPFYFYVKLSDDDGLNITLSPGMQKDNTMSGFQPAMAASAELTLGFFKEYMFKAKIEGFYGGAGALTTVGDYWIVAGGVRLVKRF